MARSEKITVDHPIWEEIRLRAEEDSAVAGAAQSPLVQEVLGVFVECDFGDPTVEKAGKRALRRYVVNCYNVPPGRCEEVFATAREVMLLEGQADG